MSAADKSAHAASPAGVKPPASLRARPEGVFVIPGRGLQLPQDLPFDRWLDVGRQLSGIHSSSIWCLGDWLAFGQDSYRGYRDAVEQTALDYQTLRNYAWVAKRFSLSRRRDTLSFGHHAEVAALAQAEQDFWLRKAEESGWSVKRLRREVHTSLSQRSAGPATTSAGTCGERPSSTALPAEHSTAKLLIQLTPKQLAICHAAAGKADLPLEAWAAMTLENSARQALATS